MQWDCRNYNFETYQHEVQKQRLLEYATIYCSAFISSRNIENSLLLLGYSTGHIRLIDPLNRKKLDQLYKTKLNNIQALTVIQDVDSAHTYPLVLVGGKEGKIFNFRINLGDEDEMTSGMFEEVGTFEVFNGSFEILSIKADTYSNKLFIGVGNGMIIVWDLNKQEQLFCNQAHSLAVYDLDVSSHGQRLVTASSDATIKVWDIREMQTAPALQRSTSHPVTCAKFDQAGNWVIYGTEGKNLAHYSIQCDQISQQTELSCTPLDICVQPSEVLVVGSCPQLIRYNFLGDRLYDDNLKTKIAYSVDVDAFRKMISVAGVRGAVDVLSPSGTYYL